MKVKFTQMAIILLLLVFATAKSMAQGEVTYTFDASELEPAEEGYYIAGTEVDENGDGVMEFHNGCEDYYQDSHHFEEGIQQGFTYGGAMIMPDCEGKGTPPEGFDANGYIQLTKFKYPDTDSLEFGFIQTPQLTNVERLTVNVGTDLSLGGRQIFMEVEASFDGGETWNEAPSIKSQLTNQGGNVIEFVADGEDPAFNAIAQASAMEPVMLRIRSTNPPGMDKGERLKVFSMEVVASEGAVTGLYDEFIHNPFFEIQDQCFVAERGVLHVYRISGAMVGSGERVKIPGSGLYVVRSDKGRTVKVFVR